MLFGQFRKFHQRREIAIHAEQCVGHDQTSPPGASPLELGCQGRAIGVGKHRTVARDNRQPSIKLA